MHEVWVFDINRIRPGDERYVRNGRASTSHRAVSAALSDCGEAGGPTDRPRDLRMQLRTQLSVAVQLTSQKLEVKALDSGEKREP